MVKFRLRLPVKTFDSDSATLPCTTKVACNKSPVWYNNERFKSGLNFDDVISLASTHGNYCKAISMFENIFVAKRKDNKRFEKNNDLCKTD